MRNLGITFSICFISLAVFGFVGVHQAMDHKVSCVGSLAQNSTCPPESSSLDFISFHLNGLKSFSTGLNFGLLTWALLALAVTLIFSGQLNNLKTLELAPVRVNSEPAPILRAFREWLVRLERKDDSA